MRILSITSEYYPLIKTGGLADVAGALPQALQSSGIEMRTLLPAYPAVLAALGDKPKPCADIDDLFGGPARLLVHEKLILLEAPHLYNRPGNPYLGPDGKDWADNDRRFAALAWIGHEIALCRHDTALGNFTPDIVHGHDWQAGLTPAYLRFSGETSIPPTILTVHNLAFQGLFGAERLGDLRLPLESFNADGLEYYGWLSFLKAGLHYSDAITTVSPTYAREIQTADHGMGMDGLLRARSRDLAGIVNGIDDTVWNPKTDPLLPKTYKTPAGKAACKSALQERMGLDVSAKTPLFCVISRLTRQKGLDLLLLQLNHLLDAGGQLALLGSGDGDLEAGFEAAARKHPGRIGCVIGYDETLAHLLQAGSDAIIIPSRFEPCGLTQLCALRYGTIPIVSRVGGLADTIIDANPAALTDKVATGFQFLPVDGEGLISALDRFTETFHDPTIFKQMQSRAMSRPVGWNHAAQRYADLYQHLLK